jgi:hypothetical protein
MVLLYIYGQILEKFGGEMFTKMFGESDNKNLARVLFNVTIPRMVNYLREFEAKKHIE